MTLDSSMNMRLSNCTVQTDLFHLINDLITYIVKLFTL